MKIPLNRERHKEKERMGLFGFFKKKKVAEPALPHAYAKEGVQGGWEHGSIEQAATQREGEAPLQPLDQLQPQPLNRPSSLNESEVQALISKLDLINARLEMINQRLAHLEQTLLPQQQQTQQQIPRW